MEILKVQNLCKTYGTGEAKVDALKNVSFSLEKGEFVAVVGESGSGKSTLLNCIGALDVPTSGTVTMDGNNLFSMKEEERTIFRRRNIGFIFQSFQLVSELTVEQNIAFPLLLDIRIARLNRTKKPFAKPAFWRSAAACRYWQGIDYKTEVDSCGRADRQSG